ncbi:MAG: hypothetical protein P4L84_26430 [Isosphaeraceae bacterium]|nr:hypothetical protein [Isosphaeraceae bacterium]
MSRTVNTLFVERQHGTDRGQHARKAYPIRKDWRAYEPMTYHTQFHYSFCWAVQTSRHRAEQDRWQQRTPVMAAELTDHVWCTREWVSFRVVQVAADTT